MFLSTMMKPPKAAADESKVGAVDAGSRYRGSGYRARRARRILVMSMLASMGLHFVFVVLSPIVVRYAIPGSVGGAARLALDPQGSGTRIVDIVVTENPALDAEPRPEVERRTPRPDLDPVPNFDDVAPDDPLTAAQRLRPRVGDWRLWVTPPVVSRGRTPAERAADLNAALAARIEFLNDSLAAEEAARMARNDWTVGEEGNRWGISPDGKIHLGPVTLPFPVAIGPTREQAEAAADWQAIQQQAGQAALDEAFNDRVKAIREQREKEKEEEEEKKKEGEAKEDSTSNGN